MPLCHPEILALRKMKAKNPITQKNDLIVNNLGTLKP
jgi:hypothetical protein